MEKEMLMNILEIQPSQLYISTNKLEAIKKWFNPFDASSYNAIPVKELDGKIIFVDGHTRALAAFLQGVKKLKVYWEYEDLSWEAYSVCVGWCESEGIASIADLKDRVIDGDKYEELWIGRCKRMHEELEQNR